MEYIKGEVREQIKLFSSLDDYISDDNIINAIDYYVNKLDMKKLGFKNADLNRTGRPSYNPKDMLKLYMYGYMNGITSSRKLEKEARRNIEVLWLLKEVTPDDRTICNFLSNNKKCIKPLFMEFVKLCKSLDLVSKDKVAIDSGKIKAVNSKKNHITRKRANKESKELEKRVEKYLDKLSKLERDENAKDDYTKEEIKTLIDKIEKAESKKEELDNVIKEMDEKKENQISKIDEDSRMIKKNGKMEVCFNVHMTVEEKKKFLIDFEVTNEASDQKRTSEMAIRAKEILSADKENLINEDNKFQALMDKGYFESTEIKRCIDNGIDPYIPHYNQSKRNKGFRKCDFEFDEENNIYICPNGKRLKYVSEIIKKNKKGKRYLIYKCEECLNCKDKEKCTKTQKRKIERWEDEKLIEKHKIKMDECKSKHKDRASIVEHVVGNIKSILNHGQFTVKSIIKTSAQFGMAGLAYNFKKAIKLLGINTFIEKVKDIIFIFKRYLALFSENLANFIKNELIFDKN